MAEGVDEGRFGGSGVPLSHNHHHPTASSNVTSTYRPNIPQSDSWTPFSGMPSSPVSSTGLFPWETLNTSTPTNAFSNSQLPPIFTSDYPYGLSNVLSSASDDSGYIQNDNMSYSSPTSVGSPIQRPLYPTPMPGAESLELYAEAIKQYQQEVAAMQFNQFPTSPPSPDLSSPASSPQSTMMQEPIKVQDKKDLGKPTYSDIAKSLKNKPMHKEGEIPKSKSPTEGLGKTQRQQLKRSGVSKNHSSRSQPNNNDGNFGNVVSPDSKYGLDHFEDVDSGSRSDRSSILGGSNESLSYRSRQGSTSSLSSGTSAGIEDVHFPKPFNIQAVKENDGDQEIGNKEEQKKEPELEKKSASAQKEKSGKFFDPRRIFQTKETNKKKTELKEKPKADMILNNGKPSTTKPHSAAHKKADYINNDLRDSRKRTNQNTASSQEDKKVFSEPVTQNGAQTEKNKTHGIQQKETPNGRSVKKSSPNLDWEAIDEYVNNVAEKCKNGVKYIISLLVTVLVYIFGVFMYIVFWCVHIIGVVGVKVWNWCSLKFFSNKFTYKQTGTDNVKRKIGLEENIVLPTTGEEAMKRLLACKGKDPYSILGLRVDVTDEEVKKYYRKQAILVHPDKNKELGAEESFKILGHAFEMIGEPTKRLQFDAKTKEESDAESAMREFSDLLTKLQEKIQEASNLMRCDNCNGKHKRTPINRPWYSARFCEKCNINHSAKEGDVWAETTMLGFCWHYYAIMDGNVFDITEWVACHKDFFKHMQANAHPVLYRIATDGNRNHRNQGNQSREAELEDFINQLFNKANMSQDGGGGAASSPWQQQQHKSHSSSSQWNAGSGGGKKSRKKKKRH